MDLLKGTQERQTRRASQFSALVSCCNRAVQAFVLFTLPPPESHGIPSLFPTIFVMGFSF